MAPAIPTTAQTTFHAQVAEVQLTRESLQIGRLKRIPCFADKMGEDDAAQRLEIVAQLAEEVFHPLNEVGDREGCSIDADGNVTTFPGMAEAYHILKDTFPVTALSAPEEFGGLGLPQSLVVGLSEIASAANQAAFMYPGLTMGAIFTISRHGSEELKQMFLPKMIEMDWGGTMCLTDPGAGTALKMLAARAVPVEDPAYDPNSVEAYKNNDYNGLWEISGPKIFISAGEDDFTTNKVHIVLAKAPNAPPGNSGISVFVVPKFLPDENGNWTVRNGVKAERIEDEKLGIHGNSTCVMNFDRAKGWKLGNLGAALEVMGDFMSDARVYVGGAQAIGQMERAIQQGWTYAWQRKQPAEIGNYPGVYNRFVEMDALATAGRMLNTWVAYNMDVAHHSEDSEEVRKASQTLELFTSVLKGFNTEAVNDVCYKGMQTQAGNGYTTQAVHQISRDARILSIYEGENHAAHSRYILGQIVKSVMARVGMLSEAAGDDKPDLETLVRQATDVTLKVAKKPDGTEVPLPDLVYQPFFEEMTADIAAAHGKNPDTARLERAADTLANTITSVALKGLADQDEALADADDVLKMFGLVAGGMMSLKLARTVQHHLDAGTNDPEFLNTKRAVTSHYLSKIMEPQVESLKLRMATKMAFKAPGKTTFERNGKAFVPRYDGPDLAA